MSYDEKSQKTLAVVKAMEEALGANSNSMECIYNAHKKLPAPEGISRAVGDKV